MSKRILITGGAGFIGSHLADALLKKGHQITILDNLHPQIHKSSHNRPKYLNKNVNLVIGDIRNQNLVSQVVKNVDIVYHLAAHTGVGQSMYQIKEYMDVNVSGTAILLESILKFNNNLDKIILASSRAVYGEGAYECNNCGIVFPQSRKQSQFKELQWDPKCPSCSQSITATATSEAHKTNPSSVYAISKLSQEQLFTIFGRSYQIPVVILRFFNVYGARQSLENPYTGVLSTFITRLQNQKSLKIYEDGYESRDFVHVSDVVRACQLAQETERANNEIFNIGTGKTIALMEVAQILTQFFNGSTWQLTGQYRVGDIRHCFADITKAHSYLKYQPAINFVHGVKNLIEYTKNLNPKDLSELAEKELRDYGLSISKGTKKLR